MLPNQASTSLAWLTGQPQSPHALQNQANPAVRTHRLAVFKAEAPKLLHSLVSVSPVLPCTVLANHRQAFHTSAGIHQVEVLEVAPICRDRGKGSTGKAWQGMSKRKGCHIHANQPRTQRCAWCIAAAAAVVAEQLVKDAAGTTEAAQGPG